jgi:hypothetical protein
MDINQLPLTIADLLALIAGGDEIVRGWQGGGTPIARPHAIRTTNRRSA